MKDIDVYQTKSLGFSKYKNRCKVATQAENHQKSTVTQDFRMEAISGAFQFCFNKRNEFYGNFF